jgi:probable rRNA maturation factor
MALLVVHGCLHILGWEHDDEADRAAMMVVETAVLRGCGLPHPLAKGA